MILTTFALASLTIAPAADAAMLFQDPPVKIWMNKGDVVNQHDRVRVHVRTQEDGYLLVLHVEPDGRIRLLYPLDPYLDNFIRGGSKVEIRGRGDREAFRVYDRSGYGTLYAAFFRDPFEYRDFVFADHWDYRALEAWRIDGDRDAETELTALVQHLAGQTFFQYDLLYYGVGQRVAHGGRSYTHVSLGYGGGYWPYYYDGWSFGISFGYGYRSHRYSHLRFCDPFLYDPWICGSWYRHSYYYGPWYPYWYSPWHYAYYRPYPSYYDDGYYYRPGPNRGRSFEAGHLYQGRYAFKPDQQRTLSDGIGLRNRYASASADQRRTLSGGVGVRTRVGEAVATSAPQRRAVPVATEAQRRTVPATTVSSDRRTVTPQPSTTREPRAVQPAGWGVTNGRRTVGVSRSEPPTRVEPDRGRAGEAATRRPATGASPSVDREAVRQPATERPAADRRPVPAQADRPATTRSTDRPVQPTRSDPRRRTDQARPQDSGRFDRGAVESARRQPAARPTRTSPVTRTPTSRSVTPQARPAPVRSFSRDLRPTIRITRPSQTRVNPRSSRPQTRPMRVPSRAPRPSVRSAPSSSRGAVQRPTVRRSKPPVRKKN